MLLIFLYVDLSVTNFDTDNTMLVDLSVTKFETDNTMLVEKCFVLLSFKS
jgi:hypothetical protein